MRRLLPFAVTGTLAGVVLALPPGNPARGCAVAFRTNQPGTVGIASESAIIVWDEAAKTEHFIRRATFATTSADFGFLVPTPTAPDLTPAEDSAFDTLANVTAPRVVYETRIDHRVGLGDVPFGCGSGVKSAADFAAAGKAAPAAPAVEVLSRQRVGRYDTAVLRADDPKKLRDWLEEHGYQARAELVEWLRAYTDAKWVITAFKIAGQTGGDPAGPAHRDVTSSAVRMSFKADKPFYPYREPEDARRAGPGPGARLLRVYLAADKRYAGTIGSSGDWPGQTVWANPVAADVIERAAGTVVPAGRPLWLTEFEDRSSPRPGTDEVYFAPAADPSRRERPPVVYTTWEERYWPGWDGLAALFPLAAVVGLYLFVRRFRRR